MDSFHVRCLRKIDGICHSMISKILNSFVLEKYGGIPLSSLLLRRQLMFFEKIVRLPSESILRKLVFQGHSYELRTSESCRRGRPRQEWSNELQKIVDQMLLHDSERREIIKDPQRWKNKVWHFTKRGLKI